MGEMGPCDFLPVMDLFSRTVYVFFTIELGSRRGMHNDFCMMRRNLPTLDSPNRFDPGPSL